MKSIIIQKSIIKLLAAIIFSLIWARYIRFHELMTIQEYPLIFFGAFYLMLAWFNYLRLDGLKIVPFKEEPTKPNKHKTKQMIDYVDTKIQDDATLTTTQKLQTKLVSNIICGILLIIPSIISLF